MTMGRIALALLASLLVGVGIARAQEAPGAPEEVRVEVLVHDDGRPVPIRGTEGLRLFVDGQGTQFTATPDEPLSVAVVMDLSSSVTGDRLQAAVDGITHIFSSLGAEDRCLLLSFTRSVELHAGWDDGCPAAVEAAAGLSSGGPSALNNAVALTLGLIADAPGRPVLVLFTDGVDGASWSRDSWPLIGANGFTPLVFAVTAPAARGAGGVGGIYGSVDADDLANQIVFEGRQLQDSGRNLRGLRNTDPFWALAQLAERSGGALTRTEGEPGDIEAALAAVPDAIRVRTSLRFTPAADLAPGWHALTVESGAGEVLHRTGFASR